jgi:DNA-binding winged helix-turn-helix (wHTH) protein
VTALDLSVGENRLGGSNTLATKSLNRFQNERGNLRMVTAAAASVGARIAPEIGEAHSRAEQRLPQLTALAATAPTATEISFSNFRFLPTQRLLFQDDIPIALGSRAMDVLIALLKRPNELVRKEELMAEVWPNTFVDPTNLTVHVSALRRALGDGRNGNRFLINIPGRGYRFVEPIKITRPTTVSCSSSVNNLPFDFFEFCSACHGGCFGTSGQVT